ncbi:MAG: CocE/NonD family hydrolase [Gammaproteobacteria bacterium]
MRVVESFPHRVCEIENRWIPLSDGCRLAARMWLPEHAEQHPVPAILEYLPYRKRDFTRARDEPMHYYFAGHGYAAVRVDIRGTGDSDGLLTDEYSQQEHDDALEIIAWLAAQPWCSGAVGMMGISWGGFNSLQVAALRPPALKAIITLCASDDRYADDAHYAGGCLLNENLTWGSVLLNFSVYPPDPELVGERWQSMWRERLENAALFPALWLNHQHRDDYWKHGSVREDYKGIQCPVYAMGGWADGYSNAVPRLLTALKAPRKGLVGPWSHAFPHDSVPGPSIGFLQEALRWWDQWLKGIDTGIMNEPMYRVWMQEAVAPAPSHDERPGRWVAERSWPSPHILSQRFALNPARLDPQAGPPATLEFRSPQTAGHTGGDWCAFGAEGELPADQREDDGKSLTFDSDPFPERLEILGAPVVTLELTADRPNAMLCVRLNDIAPDGASTRVTYGLLNLAHRAGHAHPSALEPHKRYRVQIQLNDIAHAFPAAHALRLAISTSYWPIAWPSPQPVTLSLITGASSLELPVRAPRISDNNLRPFDAPEAAPGIATKALRPAKFRRTIERHLASNETQYAILTDGGEFEGASIARVEAIDLDVGNTILRRYRIGEDDPQSAQAEVTQKTLLRRADWSVRIETRIRCSATQDEFRLEAGLRAYQGDAEVFRRDWDQRVKRDRV